MGNESLLSMSEIVLEERLQKKIAYLREIEEERKFVLGQTGLHVPGTKVREYEELVARLSSDIEKIKYTLEKKRRDGSLHGS